MAGGLGQPVIPVGVPRPSPPAGHRRRARAGPEEARGAGQGHHGPRSGGHGGAGQPGGGAVRPGQRRRSVSHRRGWTGWPGQCPLPLQPAPGSRLCRTGGEGPGALARHGAQAHGRRGVGRVPQRRQVHPDRHRLGGQTEDRRLSVHDAGAASWRGAGGGSAGRHRVRDGRHTRTGRGRGRGQGAGPPLPAPHRAGAGAGGAVGPRPDGRARPRRAIAHPAGRARRLPARAVGTSPGDRREQG